MKKTPPAPEKPALVAAEAPAGERTPDFHWNGKPVFRCRKCTYERVENLEAVLAHEESHQPAPRTSRLVGPGGEALQVAGDEDDA